jgi:TctA family transporter
VAAGSPLKGFASLLLGLLLSTVGLDVVSGSPRFTFDVVDLQGGVSLIAVLIGAFAVAELMRKATTAHAVLPPVPAFRTSGGLLRGQGRVLWTHRAGVVRGSALGTVIGALPGAGADIAAWVAYAVSKRFSRTPERFGQGHVEGIVEASAANNASLSGAYVPALVFGIPGDSITAIVIGVLIIKGITPGPMVFTSSGDLIWAVYLVFIMANLLMIPLGLTAIRLGRTILTIPSGLLYPIILLFCAVGAYATNNAIFDIWVILAFGLLLWFMEASGYPAAPLVLGLVLGRILEEAFVNSMIKSGGDLGAFFDRPLAATLGVLTLIVWLWPGANWVFRRVKPRAAAG